MREGFEKEGRKKEKEYRIPPINRPPVDNNLEFNLKGFNVKLQEKGPFSNLPKKKK